MHTVTLLMPAAGLVPDKRLWENQPDMTEFYEVGTYDTGVIERTQPTSDSVAVEAVKEGECDDKSEHEFVSQNDRVSVLTFPHVGIRVKVTIVFP
jgi:hypothetical protein